LREVTSYRLESTVDTIKDFREIFCKLGISEIEGAGVEEREYVLHIVYGREINLLLSELIHYNYQFFDIDFVEISNTNELNGLFGGERHKESLSSRSV
jgi:hypothetical protein